jgi:potassium efflux system protein
MKYYLLILYLIINPAYAEQDVNSSSNEEVKQLEEILKNVTMQSLKKQKILVHKQRILLKTEQTTFLIQEQSWQKRKQYLEQSNTVTKSMLEKAAKERQKANDKRKDLRLERQKFNLEAEQQVLTTLKNTSIEITPIQEEKIQQATLIQTKIVDQTQQLLELINSRMEIAIKQTIAAINWHSQLKIANQENLVAEQEEAMLAAKAILEKKQKRLQQAQENLPNEISNLETIQVNFDTLSKMLEKSALEKDKLEVELNNLLLERQSSQAHFDKQTEKLSQRQTELEEFRNKPVTDEQLSIHEARILERENKIKLKQKKLDLEQQQIDILLQRIQQTEKRLKIAITWYDKLQAFYPKYYQQAVEREMEQKQQHYLSLAATFRWQLNKLVDSDSVQADLLNLQLQQQNELAQQVVRNFKNKHRQQQLTQWENIAKTRQAATDISESQLTETNALIEKVDTLLKEVNDSQSFLQEKLSILDKQDKLLKKRGDDLSRQELRYKKKAQRVLNKLKKSLETELKQLPKLLETGKKVQSSLQTAYKANLRLLLSKPRTLPSNAAEWNNFLREIKTLPDFFIQQFALAWRGLTTAFQNIQGWLNFAIAIAIGIFVLIAIRAYLSKFNLAIWRNNMLSISLIGIFLLTLWFMSVSQLTLMVAIILLLSFLVSKLLINTFKLWLSDVKLYRQLRWIIIVLAILTIITALAHLKDEAYTIRLSLNMLDFIDSIFMILLSLSVLPLIRVSSLIMKALPETTEAYWVLVIRLTTLVLPLLILVIAITGLIGYINLGWTIAKQLSLFLVVLIAWMVARGIVNSFIKFLNCKTSENNKLLKQVLIPLTSQILNISIFVLALFILFSITGWSSDVAVQDKVKQILDFSLFEISENKNMTLGNALLGIFTLTIVFWLAHWSRKLAEQWLFANLADEGVRQSLSTFTQYTIIALGFLVTLQVLGIDATTLAVFAGALGIGIGFGLQHIASNFISGLLLLMQRPLKTGDYIKVGDDEGNVSRIGINNVSIITPDREDVIIPNSELLNGHLINRTHSDQVLRKNLNVSISYEDDPYAAEKIIQSVLDQFSSDILSEPSYQIFLSEFAEYQVKFSIKYFINQGNTNAFQLQSQILFTIWDRFKEEGIKMPYPQQDVHLIK